MTAEEIVVAAQEALERSGGMDVVYIHNAEGAIVCAVVGIGWLRTVLPQYAEMPAHSHIEPGMF